jgi:hypothetical protein
MEANIIMGNNSQLVEERFKLVKPVVPKNRNATMNDQAVVLVFNMAWNVFTKMHPLSQCILLLSSLQ